LPQGLAADPQNLCSISLVPAGIGQHPENLTPLHLQKGERTALPFWGLWIQKAFISKHQIPLENIA